MKKNRFPLFDSHFHALVMASRGMNIQILLEEAHETGLIGGLEVAIDEERFEDRLELASRFPWLILSAGIHPAACNREREWQDRFNLIEIQAVHPAVQAIGETGLDFYREYAPVDLQEMAFRYHLELAARLDKPVIIHNRDADAQILRIFRESPCRKGIMHCFSSDWETARAAIDLGLYISFAGNLTYKMSEKIRHTAKLIPADRLLIETDAPYMSPQPVRGNHNRPSYVEYTLACLAEIRNTDIKELAETIINNGRSLKILK